MDIVTAESIYGFESLQFFNKKQQNTEKLTTERVVLPDTSSFLHSPMQNLGYLSNGKMTKFHKKSNSLMISFPKYNNYLRNAKKFDKHSKAYVPLDLLGIKSTDNQGNLIFINFHQILDRVCKYMHFQFRKG